MHTKMDISELQRWCNYWLRTENESVKHMSIASVKELRMSPLDMLNKKR